MHPIKTSDPYSACLGETVGRSATVHCDANGLKANAECMVILCSSNQYSETCKMPNITRTEYS